MKTKVLKKNDVVRNWYVVDAGDKILGRLASRIARVLIGKNKPQYTPHVDCGDFVVVVNANKFRVTGKKLADKIYYSHSWINAEKTPNKGYLPRGKRHVAQE